MVNETRFVETQRSSAFTFKFLLKSMSARFDEHIKNGNNNGNGYNDQAGAAFAFVLAGKPDQESNQGDYKNKKEDYRWPAHQSKNYCLQK